MDLPVNLDREQSDSVFRFAFAAAQSPGGLIAGVVRDASGAAVSAAPVKLRSTSMSRGARRV